MTSNKSTAICILLGLLAIALALPVSVKCFTSSGHSVTVKGLCEREVQSDRAIWPIVYKEGGNIVSDLAATVEKKNAEIVAWLLSEGISKDEITFSAPKLEDQRANGWTNRVYDYVMTSVITVCTGNVSKVIELQTRQTELLSRGIAVGGGSSWEYPVTYEYTGLNDIKPEMIEQATCSAREAAAKFAKDSGSKVGKIISATQGQFSISDRDANTPYIKTIRVVTTVNYQLL